MAKMGRPKIEINWTEFEKLCGIQCTLVEIADWFRCSEDTIERAVQTHYGETFAETFKRKSSGGRISLRRKQYEMALKGHPTMLIWLGKQHLGQRDRSAYELSGPDGRPIETSNQAQLTDAQLDAKIESLIEAVQEKAKDLLAIECQGEAKA